MSLAVTAETDRPQLSFRDFAVAFAVVFPLAAIIAPYRHIHLPQFFILALSMVAGLLLLKTAVEDVEKLLFIFLLYIPFQKVLPGDFGGTARALNFTNVFLLLLLVGWLTRILVVEKSWKPKRWTYQGTAAVIFLAITSASIAVEALRETGDMRYSLLSDLKRWLTPLAVFFLAASVGRSSATAKRMFLAIVVTTAVIGLLGVKQFWMDMGGAGRHNLEGIRIEVTSGPSNLGALFAAYLPFLLALWISNLRRFSYWLLLFPIGWCLDSLRTTFSRGAVVAFGAAALVILWKKSKAAFALLAVAVLVILQVGSFSLPYRMFGRMTSTYNAARPGDEFADKLDTSSRTRLIIWSAAADMIKEHPLFGVGYGRFDEEVGRYRPSVAGKDAHNNFLKIAAEMGIPALAAFVILLLVCLWRAWRLHGAVSDPLLKVILLGYCGSVVGVMVANIFGSRLDSAEITIQFWAMTGGVLIIEREHMAREAPAGDSMEGDLEHQ